MVSRTCSAKLSLMESSAGERSLNTSPLHRRCPASSFQGISRVPSPSMVCQSEERPPFVRSLHFRRKQGTREQGTKATRFFSLCYDFELNVKNDLPKNAAISLAIRASCPSSEAARSPAIPCRKTPVSAASSAAYFCASKDKIIPVNTSPLPAVAIPGFPFVLKK